MEIVRNTKARIHFFISKELLEETLLIKLNNQLYEGRTSSPLAAFSIEKGLCQIEVSIKDKPLFLPAEVEYNFESMRDYKFNCWLENLEIKVEISEYYAEIRKELEQHRQIRIEKCLERIGNK